MDVADADKEYRIVLDVPGARAEDVEVTPGPANGTVAIRVRGEAPKTDDARIIRAERRSPPQGRLFARVVAVGWDADVEAAKHQLRQGVLTVVVPKRRAREEKTKTS